MTGIGSVLRNYDFLDMTKSVTEAQMALYKKPNKTWAQIGNKFYNICWYNTEAVAFVGVDVVAYLAISTLRGCGFFLPLPPAPPTFPTPLDNVDFVKYAIQRALWNWDSSLRKEMEEGIADSLSDKWNVFQVVGEWSLVYSFENSKKSSYYKPTYLTISEPLENGESYRSVSIAFDRLRQSERTAILNAIYGQKEVPSLSSAGKKVYQNIRALASKLQQGNTIYLNAYSEYIKQKAASVPSTPVLISSPPVVQPRDYAVEPSAPPIETVPLPSVEIQMAEDVRFQHSALTDAIGAHDSVRLNKFIHSVVNDTSSPYGNWHSSESMIVRTPELSPKYFIARLSILRLFKECYQKNRLSNRPNYFPWNERIRNGKTFREVGGAFAALSDGDFNQLQNAIMNPLYTPLNGFLKGKLVELSEFADMLHRNEGFLKIYEALRIDLLAR